MSTIFFAAEESSLSQRSQRLDSISPIWSLTIDNEELLAGMLAAGIGIMDDLNASVNDVNYYVDSTIDVSHFRLLDNVPEEALRYNSINKIQEGHYGIWLKGSKRFYYNLYTFQTNAFFQGIISICDKFGVDFRDYIYGFPFDAAGNQYALGGYVMAPSRIGVDAFDLDDIEPEEAYDENINEPLARTDDIITITDEYIATPEETTYT